MDKAIEIADKMAQDLTKSRVDPNELAKVAATLREQNSGYRFFEFLDVVVANGQSVERSGKTLQYYQDIRRTCYRYLSQYKDDPKWMLTTLGWTFRLMRYHRLAPKLKQPPERESTVQPLNRQKQRVQKQSDVMQTDVQRSAGIIKKYFSDRGYGFIEPIEGGNEYYFQQSQLPPDWQNPQSGQKVSFAPGQGPDGRTRALKLRRE